MGKQLTSEEIKNGMKPENNSKELKKAPQTPYYFETSDLVIIALFAALGGLSSSIIANFIRAVFKPLGIPGFGQIFAGLHIIWFVLIYLWVNEKIGAVFVAGIIKGLVELFSGNTLGIFALLIATGGAIVFEVSVFLLSNFFREKRLRHMCIAVSAGLAAVSNIIIQLETFLGYDHTIEVYVILIVLTFILGSILGGYLGIAIFKIFEQTGLLDWRRTNN